MSEAEARWLVIFGFSGLMVYEKGWPVSWRLGDWVLYCIGATVCALVVVPL